MVMGILIVVGTLGMTPKGLEKRVARILSPELHLNSIEKPSGNAVGCKTLKEVIIGRDLNWNIKFTVKNISNITSVLETHESRLIFYLPTPPLGQDMTQGQFLSGV